MLVELQPDALQNKSAPATIIFVDLIQSTLLSRHLTDPEFRLVRDTFHGVVREVLPRYARLIIDAKTRAAPMDEAETRAALVHEQRSIVCHAEVQGDEAFLTFYTEDDATDIPTDTPPSTPGDILRAATGCARAIKTYWLLESSKIPCLKTRGLTVEIGIGIHATKISLSHEKPERPGFDVALCKRLEQSSRQGQYTRIMFSNQAYQLATQPSVDIKAYFSEGKRIDGKGLPEGETAYEIKCFDGFICWDELPILYTDLYNNDTGEENPTGVALDLFERNTSLFWLGVEIATASLYRGRFQRAIDVCNRVLRVQPRLSVAWLLLGEAYCTIATDLAERNPQHVLGIMAVETLFDRAERCLLHSTRYAPEYEDGWNELGIVYFNRAVWKKITSSTTRTVTQPDESNTAVSSHAVRAKASGAPESMRTDDTPHATQSDKAEWMNQWRLAVDAFHNGSLLGTGKHRAMFWLWTMHCHEESPRLNSNPDVAGILATQYLAANWWHADPIRARSGHCNKDDFIAYMEHRDDASIISTLDERSAEYLKGIYSIPYRCNVRHALLQVYFILARENWDNWSHVIKQQWLDTAGRHIKQARQLFETWGNGTSCPVHHSHRIYTTRLNRTVGFLERDEFRANLIQNADVEYSKYVGSEGSVHS